MCMKHAAEHYGLEKLVIYASEKFWLSDDCTPSIHPSTRLSAPQGNQYEMSHFLAGVGA